MTKKIAITTCLYMLLITLLGSVQADVKEKNKNIAELTNLKPYVSQSAIPINKENLIEFLDEFITKQMEMHNIAGALVAAVDEKEIIVSKGYGYANINEKHLMDPFSSVFRAASISKLFTATAVMQLVEDGLLDLNTDINEYLGDAKVPNTYSEPITIEHLLTHTSGFDERFLNVRFSEPEMITGLYEDVIGSMPPRVRSPGEVVSYSNYGYALAGHIVEVVSGIEFEKYVEKYVLNPLNMDSSTFYEPPAEYLLEDMVTTYNYRENQYIELPPVYHNQRPAGALYSNIEDLANFAMMNLNGGTYRGVSILNRETVDAMHTAQFMNHTQLEGRGYGFYELSKKGLRIIGHDGDLSGAHTYLFLIPEVNFGMVFHFNTSIGTSIQDDPRRLLVEHFIDRFYPDYSLNQPIVEESSKIAQISNISGHYRITRYVKKSPGKLLNPNILIQFIVTQDRDGKVNISQPLGMVATTEWIPYSNDLFYQTDTGDLLAYNKNHKGKVEYLYLNQGGPITLERIAWYERFWIVIAFLVLPQIVFIGIIVGWLVSTIYNRVRRKKIIKYPTEIRRSRILIRFISILGILIFSILISMILQVMQNLDSSILFLLPTISLMGWILGISSITLMVLNVKLYKNKEINKLYCILYSVCSIGGLFFTWILYYGNLLWFATS